jgi:hypothetical protein
MSIGEDGGTGKEGKNGRIVRGDTRWRQVAAWKVLEIARKAFSRCFGKILFNEPGRSKAVEISFLRRAR